MSPLRLNQSHVPLEGFFRHDRFDLSHKPEGQGQRNAVKERGHHPSLHAILAIQIEHHVITTTMNDGCLCRIDEYSSA